MGFSVIIITQQFNSVFFLVEFKMDIEQRTYVKPVTLTATCHGWAFVKSFAIITDNTTGYSNIQLPLPILDVPNNKIKLKFDSKPNELNATNDVEIFVIVLVINNDAIAT